MSVPWKCVPCHTNDHWADECPNRSGASKTTSGYALPAVTGRIHNCPMCRCTEPRSKTSRREQRRAQKRKLRCRAGLAQGQALTLCDATTRREVRF
jgi:hypothetical protein